MSVIGGREAEFVNVRMRPGLVGAAVLIAAVGLVPVAVAHDEYVSDGVDRDHDGAHDGHQHGDNDGHLPASRTDSVKVVSKTALKNVVPEEIADVGVPDGYAYLAAWVGETCKYNGIHVVDIRDVKSPREVAFLVSKEGSAPGEDTQALHIDTPYFDGDIVVSNNEKCTERAGFGGMNVYAVTKPRHPVPLAEGVGDFTVNGQGKEEAQDVDIVDITNPKKARVVAEYDLADIFPQIVEDQPENLIEVFSHDMVVKEVNGRWVMLMSYWDGGYVTLDAGGTTFVGRACPGDAAVPPGDPASVDIAVVERGVCDFTVKVANVDAAGGYDGVLIFDIEDQYDEASCLAGDGSALAPIDIGTCGDRRRFSAHFDGWGYVHYFTSAPTAG